MKSSVEPLETRPLPQRQQLDEGQRQLDQGKLAQQKEDQHWDPAVALSLPTGGRRSGQFPSVSWEPPLTSRVSPIKFDPASSLSPIVLSPSRTTPPPPGEVFVHHRNDPDGTSSFLVVSPHSESWTASSRRPTLLTKDDRDTRSKPTEEGSVNPDIDTNFDTDLHGRLRTPLPISDYPPTWEFDTSSPLVEE